jgi:hypothetical protein
MVVLRRSNTGKRDVQDVLHASQVCPLNGGGVHCIEFFNWSDIFLVSIQDVRIAATWQIPK